MKNESWNIFLSESRSLGGMGGGHTKQDGVFDGESMTPLQDYLTPGKDAHPRTIVTSGSSAADQSQKVNFCFILSEFNICCEKNLFEIKFCF